MTAAAINARKGTDHGGERWPRR